MDPKLLAKVMNMSTGRSWSSEMYHPYPGIVETAPSNRNYEGGFGSALMAKVWLPCCSESTDNVCVLALNYICQIYEIYIVTLPKSL